jgi:hypothetical protein
LPSSFLKRTLSEFQFDILVATIASEAEKKASKKVSMNGKRGVYGKK